MHCSLQQFILKSYASPHSVWYGTHTVCRVTCGYYIAYTHMGASRRLDLLNFVNENQHQQRKLISLTNYSRIVIS